MVWKSSPCVARHRRRSMRTRLLAMVCGLSLSFSASADLVHGIHFTQPGTDFHNDGAWTLGYEFYVAEDVSLRSLGYYDANADGLLENHPVALWTTAGELLASTVVTNASQLDGWFRWEAIAPINLRAGTSYVIGGFNTIDDYMWNPADFEPDPRLYFHCASYTFGAEFAAPDQCFWEYLGFFGPNLMISDELVSEPPQPVPSPSSKWLLLSGLALFLARRSTRVAGKAVAAGSRMASLSVLFVLGAALSQPVAALSTTVDAVQGPAGWQGQVALGSRYLRYEHDNVGAIVAYDLVFDADGNYLVPVGEKLRWVWLRDGQQLSAFEFTFVGGSDLCWVTHNGQQQCGAFDRFLVYSKFKCRPETGNYTLLVFRNGDEIKRQDFDTERFKMASYPSMWEYPPTLRPKSLEKEGVDDGQQKPVRLRVTDDLGCGLGLKDVEVSIQSFVVPQTNSHSHFSAEREGTGRFVEVANHPAELSVNDTKVDGKTNDAGFFIADYKAQGYALSERVVVTLRRPAKDGFPEQRIDGTFGWDIKAGDFVEANIFPNVWDQNNYCHHDNEARSLRAELWEPLLLAISSFTILTGEEGLKLNDASFPWGGTVDTLDATCNSSHQTHRTGVDIDIEPITISGNNLLDSEFELIPGYLGETLIFRLNSAMLNRKFGRDCNSTGIHYRYGKNTPAEQC